MKDKKEEIFLARVADACERNYEPRFFDFCDEAMQSKIERLLKGKGEPYAFWGGMEGAARQMLCIYPEYCNGEDLKWPLMAAAFQKNFSMDHRNVLGELMAMGITRECLGDIHVGENEVQIIFAARMKPFFEQNLNKMKGRSITVEYRGPEEIRSYTLQFKSLDLVVSSLRVDGIIGKIWGFSRQDALTYIKQRRLRVNYEEITKNDFQIKVGDILALRGKGKARIAEIGGMTKKGNTRLVIEKYI